MRYSTIAAFIGFAASPVFAAPAIAARYAPFPLADGFPNPSASELQQIENGAGGTLSNGPAPLSLSNASTTNLRLIAFNEIFEVAYFTDLLHNITSNQPSYTNFGAFSKAFVVDALTAVIDVSRVFTLTTSPTDIRNSKSNFMQ
jgi:phosphatidate phosphatase PAH1